MLALTLGRQSWAHRIPVGWKLAGLFAVTLLVFPVDQVVLLVGALCGAGMLYASLGRDGCVAGIRALKPVWWFAVIIAAYHGFIGDFERGAVILLKMIALLALANFVTMTSRLSDMMDWVSWVLTPLKLVNVPPERIALAFALVIRFTPTLSHRAKVLSEAWRARSHKRLGVRIVSPLAISALDDAEQMAEALRARGGVN